MESLTSLIRDLRFAARVLWQRPAFTAGTVLTLALGIGVNIAVFSAVRAVLLDDPPYPDAARIVRISIPVRPVLPDPLMYEDLIAIRSRSHVFQTVGVCTWETSTGAWTDITIRGNGDAERTLGPFVSPEFFTVFGIGPVLGRTFADTEYATGAHVTVLSYGVWQSQFGGSTEVLGRTIQIDREPWVVVGVMPRTFAPQCQATESGGLWRPFVPSPTIRRANLKTYARLSSDIFLAQAQREVDDLRAAKATVSIGAYGARVEALNAAEAKAARPGLLLLQGVAAFLLLIACANLANLFLAHGTTRQHELRVRKALGAGRWRLIRQLLTEATLVAAAGSLAGVLLAYWVVPYLELTGTGNAGIVPARTVLSVGGPEVVLAAAVGGLTTLLFGLAPAWLTSNVRGFEALRTSRQATASHGPKALRAGLVAAEVLLAVVILTGTALLLRSFAHIIQQPLGFDPKGLVVANLYTEESRQGAIEQIEQRLASRLGNVAVAAANPMPFGSTVSWNFALESETSPSLDYRWCAIRTVSMTYFSTLRTQLVRGRLPAAADADADPMPVVVNETFVDRFGHGREVLGRRVLKEPFGGTPSRPMVVVGVVADTRSISLTSQAQEAIYLPIESSKWKSLAIAVRAPNTKAIQRVIREVVREADPDIVILRIDTLEATINARELRRRFYLAALMVLGGLAAMLAGLGVYAVMSQAIGQRLREFGIRIALGATPSDVRNLVIAAGVRPIAFGAAGGMLAAWWLAGWLNHDATLRLLLFRVSAQDPISIGATALCLVSGALVACWIPARRTRHIDPIEVLRTE